MQKQTKAHEIRQYYDDNALSKLRGYVNGNPRVEHAWQTVVQWAPEAPVRILEIGCGVGDMCWRTSCHWPKSEIVGLDISPKSIEIARTLFCSSQITFIEGSVTTKDISGTFDLILLIDVYEHIAKSDRAAVHGMLGGLCGQDGRIILSFPTTEHLSFLRESHPEQIQPIDEDIDFESMVKLASDISAKVLSYTTVSVWHSFDYAHAVLGRDGFISQSATLRKSYARRFAGKLLNKRSQFERARRMNLVRRRLGDQLADELT